MQYNKEQELEDALEQQIDIVLKLEEERLALQKENKTQKDDIQELKKMIQISREKKKYFSDATSQTKNKKQSLLNQEIQTELMMNASIFQEKNSIKQEKKILTTTKQVTKKLTKIQPNISDKENCRQSTVNAPVSKDQEILAEELKRLTKENRSLKLQERQHLEAKKKLEKENGDLSTQMEIKNQNLQKLRNEITEISSLLNTDKYKTIKLIEQKLQKEQEQNKQLNMIIEDKNQEQILVNEELLQFKECLNKIQNDYEKLVNQKQSTNIQSTEQLIQLQKENKEFSEKNQFTVQQLQMKAKMIEELSIQINKMNEEIEFYKSISLSSKSQAEKAQNDAEYYKLQYFNLRNQSSFKA